MSKSLTIVLIVLASLTLIAAQCAGVATTPAEGEDTSAAESATKSGGPQIKVMEPFARASMPNGAVYMHLMNEGDAEDRLLSADSDVADAVELHESKMDENGVMKMSPIEAVIVPAGGSATLEPGGMHVMLLGLKEDLATGETFELTLNFETSVPQTLMVEVAESMTMDHGDGAHGDGDNGQ